MSVDLEAICGGCGHPIATGAGYLHIGLAIARCEEDADHTWQVHHTACDPHKGTDDCYWIDIEQITSRAGLLRWSAHLMAKRWLEATDWDDLLREAAGEIAPVRLRPVAGLRAA